MDVVITGLTEWLGALAKAEAEVDDKTQRVVGFGCNAIKKDWQRRWTGYAHLPHLPRAISYDVVGSDALGYVRGVVGPDRLKEQGGLGHYIEFGTITSGPIPGGLPAHATEEPKFVNAMGDMAEKLLD